MLSAPICSAQCPLGSATLAHVPEWPPFLRLNTSPSCRQTTFYLSTLLPSVDIWGASTFCRLQIMLLGAGYASVCHLAYPRFLMKWSGDAVSISQVITLTQRSDLPETTLPRVHDVMSYLPATLPTPIPWFTSTHVLCMSSQHQLC